MRELRTYTCIAVRSPSSLSTSSHASFLAVVFEVPAGLVIKTGELSHSLCLFSSRAAILFLSCGIFLDFCKS